MTFFYKILIYQYFIFKFGIFFLYEYYQHTNGFKWKQ